MRINDPKMAERVALAMSDSHTRKIISTTVAKAKSANDLSEELSLPLRSVYRYVEEMCELGLLTGERQALIESGGKYTLYRSMVKSVTVSFEGNRVEVDLIPNEDIIGRFMRLWASLGGRQLQQ
jgi:hypothetical protein